MSPSFLRNLGLVLATWVVLGAVFVVDHDWEAAPSTPQLDCEARPVDAPVLDRTSHALHVALIQIGPDSEAVLDAVSVSLQPERKLEFSLSFSTPEPQAVRNASRSRLSSIRSAGSSPAHRRRELPQGFGRIDRSLEFHAEYFGLSEDLHLIGFDKVRFSMTNRSPNGSVSSSGGSPRSPLAIRTGQPTIRHEARSSTFWAAIVLPSDEPFEAGKREAWRKAFRDLPITDPLPDRRAIDRAVQRLVTTRSSPDRYSNQVISFGPLADRWTGAFVLGDAASYADSLEVLRSRPDHIEQIRRLATPGSEETNSAWFASSDFGRWLDFMASCESGLPQPLGTGHAATLQWLRFLRLDPRLSVAQLAAKEVCESSLGVLLSAHLVESPLESEDPTRQAAMDRVRDHAIAGLPTPWKFLVDRLWILIAGIPALALLVVTTKRQPNEDPLRIRGLVLFTFAVGCFFSFDGTPIAWITIPMSIWFARRWLHEDIEHRLGERLLLALTLTTLWIWALQSIDWFFTQPHLDFVVSHSPMAAWILVARGVVRDGRWEHPARLGVALIALIAATAMSPFEELASPWALVALVIAILAFLAFLAGGTKAPERPKMQWTSP